MTKEAWKCALNYNKIWWPCALIGSISVTCSGPVHSGSVAGFI